MPFPDFFLHVPRKPLNPVTFSDVIHEWPVRKAIFKSRRIIIQDFGYFLTSFEFSCSWYSFMSKYQFWVVLYHIRMVLLFNIINRDAVFLVPCLKLFLFFMFLWYVVQSCEIFLIVLCGGVAVGHRNRARSKWCWASNSWGYIVSNWKQWIINPNSINFTVSFIDISHFLYHFQKRYLKAGWYGKWKQYRTVIIHFIQNFW